MIRVKARNFNPYEAAKAMLTSDAIDASMNSEMLKVGGNNIEDSVFQYILGLDHTSISNEGEEHEKRDNSKVDEENDSIQDKQSKIIRRKKSKEGVNYTYIPKNQQNNSKQNQVSKGDIKPFQIWKVDFGEPIGDEFGYMHYALVYHAIDEHSNAYIVFPCTSQFNRNSSTYSVHFSNENVLELDGGFMAKPQSYVRLEHRKDVDICRFKKCVGTLTQSEVAKFIDALKESQSEEVKKAAEKHAKYTNNILMELDVKEKRLKTKDSLEFTPKQQKIIDKICLADALSVANNQNYTYSKKVEALLGVFGLPIIGDGAFLIDLVKSTRNRKHFDLTRALSILGAKKGRKKIKDRLNDILKKRFNDGECLYDLILLINMLAD